MAGVDFYSHLTITPGTGDPTRYQDLQALSLGFLIKALQQFSQEPYVGGKRARGNGCVRLEISIRGKANIPKAIVLGGQTMEWIMDPQLQPFLTLAENKIEAFGQGK